MAIKIVGASNNHVQVESEFAALEATLRPEKTLNWQSTSVITGGMTTVTAGTSIWSFRPATAYLTVVRRVAVSLVATVGFTAGQALRLGLFRAFYPAATDSGGTSVVQYPSGNRHRTSPTTSPMFNPTFNYAGSGSGGLTAGTLRSLETVALSQVQGYAAAGTAGLVIPQTEMISHNAGDYPLVLEAYEGMTLLYGVTGGAGGTAVATVQIEWAEAQSY